MRQKYHITHIRTCFPIEEHVASILTPHAFKLLQHEIELPTKYATIETNNNIYIVQHHTIIEGGHYTKDREEVALRELDKFIQVIKSMP
ncbi:hypothetical protein RYX36_015963, partial [Vicia faba]